MYLRELEEGSLERATIMDRVASRALQVGAWAREHVVREGLPPRARPGEWVAPGYLAPQGGDFFLTPPKLCQA